MDESTQPGPPTPFEFLTPRTIENAPRTMLFDRYRIVRELGRGGMGVVYLARDTQLSIDVALKLVPDLVAKNEESLENLRKEVLRGMALQHTGIARTHTFECDDTGAGVVMEYVDGATLADIRGAQPGRCCDPVQILPWLAQICPALDYAHREARLVHRDIKPRNIMLSRLGRIKIADFGIAATLNESCTRQSTGEASGGTPGYMSPQQTEGQRPTVLDDIYALGATIYDLLTGKPPFYRGSGSVVVTQVLQVVAPSIQERRLELDIQGKDPIPEAWERVIAACLSKDSEKRPHSATNILERLTEGLAPKEANAGGKPGYAQASFWIGFLLAATIFLFAVTLGLVWGK